MLKDATYQEKFTYLKEWMPQITTTIKKDLKNEHLKKDPQFCKKYIGKSYLKVTVEDLSEGYLKAIEDDQENVAEFIFQRWLLKNSDVYDYFAEELNKIDENFTEIETLDKEISSKIAEESSKQFGTLNTYLFSIINSVVFPKEVYDSLLKNAKKEATQKPTENETSSEELIKNYETQMKRLVDKYEKKLSGLEKRYLNDTSKLKDQIRTLQRKLG